MNDTPIPRKKVCSRCGENKWLKSGFYYRPAMRCRYGYDAVCKECRRKEKNDEYARNRKKPEGRFWSPSRGKIVEHKGYAVAIYWSEDMISRLKRLFPRTKNAEIARELGVSESTLHRKVRELGLTKDADWQRANSRRSAGMARVVNMTRGNSGQIKKGEHKSRATEFKPKNIQL